MSSKVETSRKRKAYVNKQFGLMVKDKSVSNKKKRSILNRLWDEAKELYP
jgi:hypothetical protein